MRTIPLFIAAALVAAACTSGSDGGDAAGGNTSNAGSAEVTDDPSSPDTAATTDTIATDSTPTDTAAQDARTEPVAGVAGAASLDDPYVATFGNGGYDVEHYDLGLDWNPDSSELTGVATISATATKPLASFNLDLVGLAVDEVTVNGEAADFDHTDPELAITPASVLPESSDFDVVVKYHGVPVESQGRPGSSEPSGWHTREGYAYVAGEPVAASTFHPANDHPSDKASFTYRITAPAELTVAASGTLMNRADRGDTTTWTFSQPHPQATYLTTIVIGDFERIDDGESESGVPVRNVIDRDLVEGVGDVFDNQPAMIDAFEKMFGKYPYDVYGSAVVKDSFGGALETQTLSIFGADVIGFGAFAERVVAHELAHQWFGNSVSLDEWGDIWLNEGFASYAEALWGEISDPDFSYEEWIRETLQFGPELAKHVHRPDVGDLFGIQVYQRGALTLHALRREVGDETFFTILTTWTERFGGGNATSADFEALAEELSGEDLDEFFNAWLRTEKLPAEIDGIAIDTDSAAGDDFVTLDDVRAAVDDFTACLTEAGVEFGVDPESAEPDAIFEELDRVFAEHQNEAASCESTLAAIG